MSQRICRHCRNPRRTVNRPRGLCWRCWHDPAILTQYPSTSIYARRSPVADSHHARPTPRTPTTALPGTPSKIAVLEARAARGEALWHPEDAVDTEATVVPRQVSIDGNPGRGWPTDEKGPALAPAAEVLPVETASGHRGSGLTAGGSGQAADRRDVMPPGCRGASWKPPRRQTNQGRLHPIRCRRPFSCAGNNSTNSTVRRPFRSGPAARRVVLSGRLGRIDRWPGFFVSPPQRPPLPGTCRYLARRIRLVRVLNLAAIFLHQLADHLP